MGRPPANGGPIFRFIHNEVMEMEACLREVNNAIPSREVINSLAEKFSASAERAGKILVQPKQVWNWFQNRRYAQKAKMIKAPRRLCAPPIMARDDVLQLKALPAPAPAPSLTPIAISIPIPIPISIPITIPISSPILSPAPASPAPSRAPCPSAPAPAPAPFSVPAAVPRSSDIHVMEFEAKSARDGAWYDVAAFLSHRKVDTGDPDVLVHFSGFNVDEDEWVNVIRCLRLRSLPCEANECVLVLPGDLILCFQEGKEQALYFDARVLDAQRKRHDIRGCRCRFWVRYDHDQSEEIVPLRKICRRPETDTRLQKVQGTRADEPLDVPTTLQDLSSRRSTKEPSSSPQNHQKQCKPMEVDTDEAKPIPSSQSPDPVFVEVTPAPGVVSLEVPVPPTTAATVDDGPPEENTGRE